MGKISYSTNISQRGWNHQLDYHGIWSIWVRMALFTMVLSLLTNPSPSRKQPSHPKGEYTPTKSRISKMDL